MAQAQYIGDVDFTSTYFAPVVTEKNRKSVATYFNSKNTTWSNRLAFQLCEDEDSPLLATWHLSPPEDGDPTRLNMQLLLNSTTHKAVIDKLHELDNLVKAEALKKCKEWWKKDLTQDAIQARHKPMIEWDAERECYKTKCKVIVPHPNPEPGKKYSKPTDIFRITPDDKSDEAVNYKMYKSDHTIVGQDAKITPIVSTVGVWFMGDSFGMSLKAEHVLCEPVVVRTIAERFQTKRKYVEAAEDEDIATAAKKGRPNEDEEQGDGVSLVDEDGSAM